MVKLKNYNVGIKYFVLFLTFICCLSCNQQKLYVSKIEGKEIGITAQNKEVATIEEFIKPYRSNIDKDLSTILSYAPQNIDKTGEWQTPLGNLFADVCMQKGNPIFEARDHHSMDMVLLNHGGLRSIIAKGNVTARTAYEIMPFENSMVVVPLKGDFVIEMLQYIIAEKKPHPISGISFTISTSNNPINIMIQGKPFDKDKLYYVGTNDYLANGGDNMAFFRKGNPRIDLDYKLRNVLIDYFKEVDTIPLITNKRITVEK